MRIKSKQLVLVFSMIAIFALAALASNSGAVVQSNNKAFFEDEATELAILPSSGEIQIPGSSRLPRLRNAI